MAPSSPRGLGLRGGVILLVIAAAVVGWLLLRRPQAAAPVVAGPDAATVVATIPDGAMFVVVIDVPALRRTEVGKRLLGHGRDIAGLGEIRSLCGGDPMDQVTQLAVAVPAAGIDAGFGVFATGPFDAEALLSCAERVVSRRGGKPVRRHSGRFAILRDASLALASAELAVADGGPFVLAEPPYLEASLQGLQTHAEQPEPNAAHRALRRLVPEGMVVATVVLTDEQRRTLADELRQQGMADSPFRAVNGGALAIRVDHAVHIEAVIRCDDAASCRGVRDAMDQARRDEARSTVARATALDGVLADLQIRARATTVVAGVSVPVADAMVVLRNVLALRRLAQLPAPLPALSAEAVTVPDGGPPVGSSAASAVPRPAPPVPATGTSVPQPPPGSPPAPPTPKPKAPSGNVFDHR